MKNNLTNIKSDNINKIDWKLLQNEMKNKFGSEIYDSWLKKIDLVDEFKNYVLLSVSTRFIRDWITSRYLDQILQIIKLYKKDISRIEFVINENIKNKNGDEIKQNLKIKDGPLLGELLQYLSKEHAYKRLNNFDEAIYKAKQWFEQNAPKCD